MEVMITGWTAWVGSFNLEQSRKIVGTRIDWVGLEIKSESRDAGCTNLYKVEADEIFERRSHI
jgi:hypothetical protein